MDILGYILGYSLRIGSCAGGGITEFKLENLSIEFYFFLI